MADEKKQPDELTEEELEGVAGGAKGIPRSAQLDLGGALQKQQETLELYDNVLKETHDESMADLRKIDD
jgi:hypothetical protein